MAPSRTPDNTRRAIGHRLERMRAEGLKGPAGAQERSTDMAREVALDVGWGRLLFAQTFEDQLELVKAMRSEAAGERDIAFYIRDPHVALAAAPQEVFLDPSHTFRLDLATYRARGGPGQGYFIRRLCSEGDAEAVNRIYVSRGMVPVDPAFFWRRRDSRTLTFLVVEDERTGAILGSITGVDHERAFNDPERGSSLWCLAVDPAATHPGIGEALLRRLAELFQARGLAYLDLSVMHDNDSAIALYEKIGFRRVPFFTLKRKNTINEKLYIGPPPEESLNAYARIIVDEARRRGIGVDVLDAQGGYFRLSYGGRSVTCRESLSELTSAVAMSRCEDKAVSRRIMQGAGVPVPKQMAAGEEAEARAAFLEECGSVVVKPAKGEQGRGVVVGIETVEALEAAIASAAKIDGEPLIEEFMPGLDCRVLVIQDEVVAAAVRQPPVVTGDGKRTLRDLVARLSRRREAATHGESRIPLDAETERAVASSGFSLDDTPERGVEIQVRKTANLPTGGALIDVTGELPPDIADSAISAARALEIPVVGVDFIVEAANKPRHIFIEANERPGLANHEPQPTAERFVDLLFPLSISPKPDS